MAAQITIDQAGLPAGTPGRSRTDGLLTGALVTLTSSGAGGGTHRFQLLWVPLGDTTAQASLAPTGNPRVWTFTPDTSKPGTYRIELIVDEGLSTESRSVRLLRMRTATLGLVIEALNERADPRASLVNGGALEIERSEDNAIDYSSAALNAVSYSGWWRVHQELVTAVENAVVGAGALLRDGTTTLTGDWDTGATYRITTLDPTAAQHVATKAYVDAAAAGRKAKQPVRALAASAIVLSGPQTIDGVSVIAGDRVLVTAQGSPVDNGIYVAAAGAWARSSDLAAGASAGGSVVVVLEGSTYADQQWLCTSDPPNDVVGTDPLTWVQYAPAATWAAVLTAGPNSGASDPVIDTGQVLIMGNTAPATTGTIRLEHGASVRARDSTDTNDIFVIGVLSDQVVVGDPGVAMLVDGASIELTANTGTLRANAGDSSATLALAVASADRVTLTNTTVTIAPNGTDARLTLSDSSALLGYSTAGLRLQALVGGASFSAFYGGAVVQSATNFAFSARDDGTSVTINGSTSVSLANAGTVRVAALASSVTITPSSTTRGTWSDTSLLFGFSTQGLRLQALVGTPTTSAFYGGGVTPSATNHSFLANDAGDSATINGSLNVRFAVGNVAKVFATATQVTIVPVATTRITVADTVTTFVYSTLGARIQAIVGTATATGIYPGSAAATATNWAFYAADDNSLTAISASVGVRLSVSGAVRVEAGVSVVSIIPNGATTRFSVTNGLATVNAIPLTFSAAAAVYNGAAIQGYKDTNDAYDTILATSASGPGHCETLAPAGLSGLRTTVKRWMSTQQCAARVYTFDIPLSSMNGLSPSGWNATKGSITVGYYVWANNGYSVALSNYVSFQVSRAVLLGWQSGPGVPVVITSVTRSDEMLPNTDVGTITRAIVGTGASAVLRISGTLISDYAADQRVICYAEIYANEYS